jgi:hypothetical protein
MGCDSVGMCFPAHGWYVNTMIYLVWTVITEGLQEASRLVVPIGALYTPLKEKADAPLLHFEPVVCKAPCRSVLNPFWYVLIEVIEFFGLTSV